MEINREQKRKERICKMRAFIKRNWELFACAAIFGTTIIFGVCTNMESANADIVEEPIDVSSTTTVVTTEPVTTTTTQTTPVSTTTTTTSNEMTTTTSTTIGWLYETDVETTETIIVDVSDGEIIGYEYEGTNDDGDVIVVVTDETKPSSHTTNTTTTTTTTTVATTTTVLQPETTVAVLEEPTEITEVETLPIDESDYILLCNCVAHEAGANAIPVYDKALVVEVVMNRVMDTRWPNTVYEVITQRKQFTGSSTYADLGTYSHKVSDQVKEAVDLYFADPSQFNHGYTGFWGDGKRNHFS